MKYKKNNFQNSFQSKITQSAPEQVIWVWEIASEGARWDLGENGYTPQPEVHEPRVA